MRLPGVARRDMSVELSPRGRMLTVRARVIRSVEVGGEDLDKVEGVDGSVLERLGRIAREIGEGRRVHVVTKAFQKTFRLAGRVDADRVEIEDFSEGMLRIRLPYGAVGTKLGYHLR